MGLVNGNGSENSETFTVDLTQYKFIIIGQWYLNLNCNASMMIPRSLFVDVNEWELSLNETRGVVANTSNNGFTIKTLPVMNSNWSIAVIGVK